MRLPRVQRLVISRPSPTQEFPPPPPPGVTTYETTHSVNCWRWHHQCGVSRIGTLTAALREALAQFNCAVTVGGREYFAATPITEGQLDRWQRALMDVAGADVTPDPAAPATTTT